MQAGAHLPETTLATVALQCEDHPMDLTSLTEATWAQLHALVDWTAPWVAHLGPLEPWLWGTSGAGALALLLAVRRGRRGGLLRRLRRPLQHLPGPVAQRLPWRETAGVVAGATALDLLTAMVRIDPQALDAIDRAHTLSGVSRRCVCSSRPSPTMPSRWRRRAGWPSAEPFGASQVGGACSSASWWPAVMWSPARPSRD